MLCILLLFSTTPAYAQPMKGLFLFLALLGALPFILTGVKSVYCALQERPMTFMEHLWILAFDALTVVLGIALLIREGGPAQSLATALVNLALSVCLAFTLYVAYRYVIFGREEADVAYDRSSRFALLNSFLFLVVTTVRGVLVLAMELLEFLTP
ncbi:MAG TPA: hypothetical protein PKO06_12780 [Candidatus Ozemobacteraceae bacterium]|nr:hypothetical protein [Candidatus Ozemobacteraceae bacterium]